MRAQHGAEGRRGVEGRHGAVRSRQQGAARAAIHGDDRAQTAHAQSMRSRAEVQPAADARAALP
ncbi:MAG TPA: hypothetical protein VF834_19310, partial [Streptosporangiaceae bacterium]